MIELKPLCITAGLLSLSIGAYTYYNSSHAPVQLIAAVIALTGVVLLALPYFKDLT